MMYEALFIQLYVSICCFFLCTDLQSICQTHHSKIQFFIYLGCFVNVQWLSGYRLPSPFCLPLGIPRPILSLSSGISRWLPNVSSSARLFAWANYHDGYRFTLSCYGSLDILAPSHRYLMIYNKLWRARHIGRPVSRGHFYQNINNAFWKMYRIEHDVTKCMQDITWRSLPNLDSFQSL